MDAPTGGPNIKPTHNLGRPTHALSSRAGVPSERPLLIGINEWGIPAKART
jgi:hypothetical protein